MEEEKEERGVQHEGTDSATSSLLTRTYVPCLGGAGERGAEDSKAVRAGLQMHRRCCWCPTETPLPGQCVLPSAAVSVG